MAGVEDRLALERLENLIRGFGWEITNTQYLEGKMIVTTEKKTTLAIEPPEPGED